MVLAFVVGTFGFNYQVTIALMAREEFGLGAEAFGLLVHGVRRRLAQPAPCCRPGAARRPRPRFLVGSALVFGVLTVVAGLMPAYVAFAVLLVPTGAAALVFSVANNSFVQLGVDPQMRGRVMALYFMCFMGGTPVGAPLIGWIAEHLGPPWGLILGGGVVVRGRGGGRCASSPAGRFGAAGAPAPSGPGSRCGWAARAGRSARRACRRGGASAASTPGVQSASSGD